MSDPYKVLGLARTATDDEVKRAYRQLSRRYHPDANLNNPNRDKAEEMFKLVQQAYEQIMYEREHPYAQADPFEAFTGAGRGGGSYSGDADASRLRAAYTYITNGRYREALNALNSVETHGAEWHYYSAVANAGLNNNAAALQHAQTAVRLAPNDPAYRQLLAHLQSGSAWYSERRTPYGMTTVNTGACTRVMGLLCLTRLCCGGSYGYLPFILCC